MDEEPSGLLQGKAGSHEPVCPLELTEGWALRDIF